jgi:hypothetical protein
MEGEPMPLPRYGVVIGTLVRFYRDEPDDFGRWYHGHVEVFTPSGVWTSALDVDTPTGVGISYRVSRKLAPSVLGPVATMPPGFHRLASVPTSGAVDYLRSPFLQDRIFFKGISRPLGVPRAPQPLPVPLAPGNPPLSPPTMPLPDRLLETMRRLIDRLNGWLPGLFPLRLRPWLRSDGNNALTALETELAGNRKVYLFGEQFGGGGKGVHDVHQNQGDPAGSQWWDQNGIWQDGAVAVERPDGRLFFWQVRFNSQASRTGNDGHPT